MEETRKIKGYTALMRIGHAARCLLAIILLPAIFVFQTAINLWQPLIDVIRDNRESFGEVLRDALLYLRIAVTGKASQKHAAHIEKRYQIRHRGKKTDGE